MVKWFTIKFSLLVITFGACIASPLMAQVADGNGTFTREQWLDKNNEVFSRYDENSDGFLDREELEKVFDALDQNDDGRIGAVEAFWPQFDRNKDSWIEAEEFTETSPLSKDEFLQRRKQTFDLLDRDDDGRIDISEIRVRGTSIFKF